MVHSTGSLLLAIDIGNTQMKIGLFEGASLVAHWRLQTDAQRTSDEYAALLSVLLGARSLRFADVVGVSLSSTVPALGSVIRDMAAAYLPAASPIAEVTGATQSHVTIAIENPQEMGADRVVDALATIHLYRAPAIVIDFGTATTFDAIDGGGRLLGTAIAPGFFTSMEGLFQRAAKLTRVELQRPRAVIGRNTNEALRSGWLYGYVGLVEGLVARIKAELGGQALVIATGGLAEDVVAETHVVDIYDPFLTLKGLQLFFALENQPMPSSGVAQLPGARCGTG